MTPIKRRLLYIFRGDLLRLRISWEDQSITLSVGYHVNKEDAKGRQIWDGSRCKANTTHGKEKIPASVINKVLQSLEDKIEKAFYHFEMEDTIPSKKELKELLTNGEKTADVDIEIAFNEFLSEGEVVGQWSKGTITQYQNLKKTILSLKSKIDLSFSSIDENTQNNIVKILTSSKIREDQSCQKPKGYQNVYINSILIMFRKFLRWAYKKGYFKNVSAITTNISLKTIGRPVIYLTWEEVMKLYKLDLTKHILLDQARDMFLFSCFTSLRYSDIHNITWSNVKDNLIQVSIQKTGVYVEIELNKYSRSIIEKQRPSKYERDGHIFSPTLSNQMLNIYIKRLCVICNFDEPISLTKAIGSNRYIESTPKYALVSMHTGRKTFIVNALSMGIAPNIVMKWTGHSDYKAMKPYISITDKSKQSAMKKFDDRD